MDLTSLLTAEDRVIDVGATSADVAEHLAAGGCPRYLALVPPAALTTVRSSTGDLAARFHPLDDPRAAIHNDTDVLVLRAPFARLLWSVRDLRHVRLVAVERLPGRPLTEAHLARLTVRLGARAAARGRVTCGDLELDVLELTGRPRPPRPRRYLSPVWGVDGLARRFEDAGLQYVALRWFENLPAMEPGEDLDLLVRDEDLTELQRLLAQEPGTVPVDLYSTTGMPGADYQGAAYYPPPLARGLLERAVVHRSGVRVPAGEDHLRSLAYHAVYHKGLRSGLPSELTGERLAGPEHDYAAALGDVARTVGVDLRLTLEGVDEYLAEVGWRPSMDTLRRLASGNPWVEKRFLEAVMPAPETPEVSVFLIRERTLAHVSLDDVLAVLDHYGFDVLRATPFDGEAAERCAAQTRGGNWGRGPFAESGGGPAVVVVALHHAPQPVSPDLRHRYPHLSNAEIYFAKRGIFDLVESHVAPDSRFNPVHSSDDEAEAWEYVDLALPNEAVALRDEVARRRASFRTTAPVLRELSRGRRAKVEVVQEEGGAVVRKTYAKGYLRHMEREITALRTLGPMVPAVPELLAIGSNWFSCPYYEDQLPHVDPRPGRPLLPLPQVRAMVAVLRAIHEQGYDLVDAKPDNFVLDPRHGLKILDFEFLHRYGPDAPDFATSYNFTGPPPGFVGDVPVGNLSYEWRWQRFTGLPRTVLVDGSVAAQHVHRAVFRLRRSTVAPGAPARRVVRRSIDAARRVKGRAVWAFTVWARRRAMELPTGADSW